MNLNKVFLIGNLTRDPELRTLPSSQAVVNFGLASNRVWKGKDGSQQKQAEFHNVVMYGRLAEITKQYLQKGAMAMIEGRIQTRTWEGKDGKKNYIGGNTLMEMGLAFFLKKKIFLLNQIPELSYKEEILGVKPILINGDLNKII